MRAPQPALIRSEVVQAAEAAAMRRRRQSGAGGWADPTETKDGRFWNPVVDPAARAASLVADPVATMVSATSIR
uniref:Uncharacterized protein n=1 Tax=Oryza meridionalis TaxID=40149 RepID=A0A0E0EXM8_9ORYZ